MSTLPVRPARRVAGKVCYLLAAAILLAGVVTVVASPAGSIWAFCVFGALVMLMVAIAFTHPASADPDAGADEPTHSGVLHTTR